MTAVQQKYIADFSLALINRTGAYHVCREIVSGLPEHFLRTRYWLFDLKREPEGLVRKVLGRAMLLDLTRRGQRMQTGTYRRGTPTRDGTLPTLFMDPLYVLRAGLSSRDIVLCHDVGPITHQDLFAPETVRSYRTAYETIRRSRPGLVFVSEASRRAFVGLFGEDFRFLEVIPLYVREAIEAGGAVPPEGVAKPFLLTVAATETRKNYIRSIAAFRQSGLAARGYSYVICGPRGNAAEEVAAAAAEADGVVKLGFVGDNELRWLYQNAAGFVLPSLLEGFGVPALEAAQRGLVTLVSAGGALEEAAGEGAITVDPLDVADIARGMVRLAEMPDVERQGRLTQVRAHAARFTREIYLARWDDLLSRDAARQASVAACRDAVGGRSGG